MIKINKFNNVYGIKGIEKYKFHRVQNINCGW